MDPLSEGYTKTSMPTTLGQLQNMVHADAQSRQPVTQRMEGGLSETFFVWCTLSGWGGAPSEIASTSMLALPTKQHSYS